VGIFGLSWLVGHALKLNPMFREAQQLNADTFKAKMAKPNYAANQKWNRKWSALFLVIIFGGILPFCLTLQAQPWWSMLLDMAVILMFYDFFYYLTHRFLFHDSGFFGGPLKWMHAVHHRQHNPCRWDSSYIHPLEVAIGLGLYVASIAVLSLVMGKFHVATVIITWFAFTEINLHNHDLWKEDRFPFRYLNTMSVMHHNHHAKFTGGNYATISLLYDWMFGTLDYGEAGKAKAISR
jgi:sterol desaturase/sphingolipid hydroxylase (fatty acid hydroxylase superfamily)